MRIKHALCLGLLIVSCAQSVSIQPGFSETAAIKSNAFTIGKTVTNGNLTVYFIKGKSSLAGQNMVTLQEAMAKKYVKVSETGDVNNLAVENLSNNLVFLQTGDIVKGGRQDRTMQYDMILPPHSGRIPLPAFCVEHGRWEQRGDESSNSFSSSNYSLGGKELKLAARKAGDQQAVWQKVAQSEKQIAVAALPPPSGLVPPPMPGASYSGGGAAGMAAAAASVLASPSGSYELTVENKAVAAATSKRVNELVHAPDGDKDVIGYAFAINGKLNSADIYGSNDLFSKVWPKQLRAAVVEALENNSAVAAKPPAPIDVEKTIRQAEGTSTKRKQQSNSRTDVIDREDDKNLLFETVDKATGNWVHKNYFTKF
jgi:hypothetical protein